MRGAAPRVMAGIALVFVAGCGLFADTVPAEWVLREPPDGRVLHLRVGIGVPCNDLEGVSVDESPTAVEVSASVRLHSGGCDDMFDVEDIEVELDEPVGDRALRGCVPDDTEAIRLNLDDPDCQRTDR